METYEEWHERIYGVMPDPWQPYNNWQPKFTAYIASKPNQFKVLDKKVIQTLFDKATTAVITQACPSYIGEHSFCSGKLICNISDEMVQKLVPNSAVVCARHFLEKLQRAHADAWFVFRNNKTKRDFFSDYIDNANVVAEYFNLRIITKP